MSDICLPWLLGVGILGFLQSLPVVGINHKDDAMAVAVVVLPKRAQLILATHVPHRD